MSIPQRIGQFVQNADSAARAGEFLMVARALLAGRNFGEAQAVLRELRATDRAIEIFQTRAAVPAGVTYDPTWGGALSQYQLASDAFAETLRNASAFDRVLGDGGFLRVPPQTAIAVTTAAASATIVGEAAPKSASVLGFTSANVVISKVVCFTVVSAELMRMSGPGPVALLGRELRGALSQVTDQYLLQQLMTGLSSIPATIGSNPLALRADLRDLLDAVAIGAGSRLYYIGSPQLAKRLSVIGDQQAGRMFPAMTPTGGTLDGIPFLVSDAQSASNLLLFDAAQCAVSAGVIELDQSRAAALQLDSSPDSPPIAASSYTNLWQQNMSALRAERFLGVSRLRTTAVAQITGLTGIGSSPA